MKAIGSLMIGAALSTSGRAKGKFLSITATHAKAGAVMGSDVQTRVCLALLAVLLVSPKAMIAQPIFQPAVSYPKAPGFGSVVVGDFNNDGKQDLATANDFGDSSTVSILLGNGDGTFQSAVNYATGSGTQQVVIGDFNGDGNQDLATVNVSANVFAESVSVLIGKGDGTFNDAVRYFVLAPYARGIGVGFFNGDNIEDLVVLHANTTITVCSDQNGNVRDCSQLSFLTGKGDGTFNPVVRLKDQSGIVNSMICFNSGSIVAFDFDGDGHTDVAATCPALIDKATGYGTVQVYLLNGNLQEKSISAFQIGILAAGYNPYALAVGDVNGDLKPDLVVANQSLAGTVSVFLANGDGTFITPGNNYTAESPASVVVTDVNGDTKADIVTVSNNGTIPNADVLLGNGDGTFQAFSPYSVLGASMSVAVGDFNGDGRPDLAAGRGESVSILLHTALATTLTYDGAVTGVYGSSVLLSAILRQTADGTAVTGKTVTFTLGNQSCQSTTGIDGRASCSITINQAAGNSTVKASFAGDINYIASSGGPLTFVISKAAAMVASAVANANPFKVDAAGGTATVTLSATVTAATGDIAKALPITYALTPVGPGSSYTCLDAMGGAVSDGVLTSSCAFATGIAVNVYDLVISIGGNFYTGHAESVVTVYDPSLGSTIGGGIIVHNGSIANFGFSVKYLPAGQPQGRLLFIEHRPGGDIKLQSNALTSLSIVKEGGKTISYIQGKTVFQGGNYTFLATAVDGATGGSAKGDQFGFQLEDPKGQVVPDLTFSPIDLTGGNISAP